MHIRRPGARRPHGPLAPLCIAALLALGLAGCGSGSGADLLTAAHVNGTGIPLAQYKTILTVYTASVARQGQSVDWQNPTGRTNLIQVQHDALEFLINLQVARDKYGHPLSSADMKVSVKRLADIRTQLAQGPQDPASRALAASLTPQAIQLLAEQDTLQSKLIQTQSVPTYHVRVIVTHSLKEAQAFQQQVQKGADFGQLAHDHSVDPNSAAQNGDLGTVYPGQLGADFDTGALAKGAHAGKYQIILLPGQPGQPGQYALFELSGYALMPLKGISDPQTQQSTFTAWLTNIVRSRESVRQDITIG